MKKKYIFNIGGVGFCLLWNMHLKSLDEELILAKKRARQPLLFILLIEVNIMQKIHSPDKKLCLSVNLQNISYSKNFVLQANGAWKSHYTTSITTNFYITLLLIVSSLF